MDDAPMRRSEIIAAVYRYSVALTETGIAIEANQWSGVIVQVSGAAIDEWYATAHKSFDNDMRETLVRLERIGKVTLLFDASGGKGVPVDVKRIAPLIDLSHTFGFDCGVAGGLSPETLVVRHLPAVRRHEEPITSPALEPILLGTETRDLG